MAVVKEPVLKKCRRFGISPAVMGILKNSKRKPKVTRKKASEYSTQLFEKQKAKFIYGVLERQFRKYFAIASKAKGKTGEKLLQILESRFDNVIYKLGFASTRREARQLISHCHFLINGKKVNIPSFLVKPGDVITIRAKSKETAKFKAIIEKSESVLTPSWLELDKENLIARVVSNPSRADIDVPVDEQLIVVLYSR